MRVVFGGLRRDVISEDSFTGIIRMGRKPRMVFFCSDGFPKIEHLALRKITDSGQRCMALAALDCPKNPHCTGE